MMNYGFGAGYGFFGHLFGVLAYGLAAFVCFAVCAVLLVLLVRFLLIGTKAAQLYIAKNSPAAPAKPAASPAVPSPATPSATVARAAAPTTTATKPVTKPRTPKQP